MLTKISPDRYVKPKPGLLGLYGKRRMELNRYEILAATVGGVGGGLFFWSFWYGVFAFFFALAVLLIGRKES